MWRWYESSVTSLFRSFVFPLLLVLGSPALADRPTRASFDIVVPQPPMPVMVEGRLQMAYELHPTNFADTPLDLDSVAVRDLWNQHDDILLEIRGPGMPQRLKVPGGKEFIAPGWQTYGNARFGYSICYPAAMLAPQPEAPNGDGRIFTGSDGATLSVYGSNNALDQTLAQAFAQAQARETERGAAISYKATRPGWYVLSGREGDSLFYIRTHFSGDQFKTFELRYPAAVAPRWNPIAARLSKCFRG